MADKIDALESISLVLYGLLGLACLISVLYSLRESDVARHRTQQWFHLFLGSFVVGMFHKTPNDTNYLVYSCKK
jgi:hypothetical protein